MADSISLRVSVYRLQEMKMARERNSTFDRVCADQRLTTKLTCIAAAAVAEYENEREINTMRTSTTIDEYRTEHF